MLRNENIGESLTWFSLDFKLNFNFRNMVLRNLDNVPVSFVFFSSNLVDKIFKIHNFLVLSHNMGVGLLDIFVFSFCHSSYSTPFDFNTSFCNDTG